MAQKKEWFLLFLVGLTSVILKWLQTELDYEVVCFTADLGRVKNYRLLEIRLSYSALNQNISLSKMLLRHSSKIMFFNI